MAGSIPETELSDQILIFYLGCICKFKREKRVFYELTTNEQQYRPVLGEALQLVHQHNYRSCLGYIYEQQLQFPEAFQEYTAVFHEYFSMNFAKLVSHEYCHGRFMARIFHLMLQLCFKIKTQQQWGLLMAAVLAPLQRRDPTSPRAQAKIIDTIQAIYEVKSSKTHPFMQELLDIIELTLTSASREISIGSMGQELNKYTDLLNKSFIVNSLTSTLRNCSKRVETFEISRKLMVSEFVAQFQQYFT